MAPTQPKLRAQQPKQSNANASVTFAFNSFSFSWAHDNISKFLAMAAFQTFPHWCLLTLCFLMASVCTIVNASERCYNFGNGMDVYPREARSTLGEGFHRLHWSKTQIMKPAPKWEATAVVNGELKELNITQFLGKYLVFFFYPLDFTFVCPTEIIAFSDRIQEFKAINTEVVACSVDSPYTHLAWIKTPRKQGGLGPLNIPLLSDQTHQISKDYGVYLEDLGHSLRGLFIIDPQGILRQITMNDLPVGRSVDETLRLVQAFQYTDQHGEVCPANWKPGSETIIPNPEEKLKYFGKVSEHN